MRCAYCNVKMKKIQDTMTEDNISFEAYECSACGERLLDGNQLHALAREYKKLRKAKEVKFAKWGNSIAVRIPYKLAKECSIQAGKEGIIRRGKEGLVITPL